jgi:hypothetical protein
MYGGMPMRSDRYGEGSQIENSEKEKVKSKGGMMKGDKQ